ncbi:MAG: GGDEF domain-containing protein [Acholeplasmatales bacterium]|nr:GGDEF domain-containing protein [Acholeplasmatales bacterium]
MGYENKEEVLKNNLIYQKDFKVYFDNLTKTLSKTTIDKIIRNLIAIDEKFSLMVFDIDNFKTITDSFGHESADEVLRIVADTLVDVLKDDALVGRYGADDFVVLTKAYDYNGLWKFCRTAMEAVRSIKSPLKNFNVTLTCGAATFPKDAETYDDLFLKIDKALYRGKLKGKNCFIVYIDALHGNIDVSNRMERSTPLIGYCHRELMGKDSLTEKIRVCNKFLCDLFLLDSYFYDAEKNKFKIIIGENNLKKSKEDLFSELLVKDDIVTVNDCSKLIKDHPKLHEYCWDNNIKSFTLLKAYAYDKYYGYCLYVDKNSKRVWNTEDKILLSYIVHMISTIRYLTEKKKRTKKK